MTIYVKKVPAPGLYCSAKDGTGCCFRNETHGCTIAHRDDISCYGIIFVRVPGPEPADISMKRLIEHQKKAFEKIKETLAELNENTRSL